MEKIKFQSPDGTEEEFYIEEQTRIDLTASIDIEPCKLCTYCWSGKE